MPSYDEVVQLRDALKEHYGERHEALRKLRRLWHGDFFTQEESRSSLFGFFQDWFAPHAGTGTNLRVVRNFIQQICVKYQTFLSPLPMIRVPVDPPQGEGNRRESNLKERVLYGTWNDGNMSYAHGEIGWYLPLMGDAFLGVWPDFGTSVVRPIVRSPEHAYPVPAETVTGRGNLGLEAIVFSWEVDERWARRMFPKYNPKITPQPGPSRARLSGKQKTTAGAEIEVLEYSDRELYQCWVGGQKVKEIKHGFGFNLFDQVQFVHVPGEMMGHGAVEQIVGLNELYNASISILFEAFLEHAYPSLVLVDPSKAPEQIMRGPGSVIPINPGGQAAYLTPPVQALGTQMGFLGESERAMKESTSMPDVNFGQFKASIVTGRAINELQGAGTGTTIEMVQSNMGQALVSFNSKALYIYRTEFADETIELTGLAPRTIADVIPKMARVKFKGRELTGSLVNDVIYNPHLDPQQKLVMVLQALGGGLVSLKYAREQIGIPDSEAMEEEILGETIQRGLIEGVLQQLQQASPEDASMLEQQIQGIIEGRPVTIPGPPLPALPGLAPADIGGLGGNGQPAPTGPPGGQLPQMPGAVLPQMPGAPPPPGAPTPGGPAPGGPPGGFPPGAVGPEAMFGAPEGPPEQGPLTVDAAIGIFNGLEGIAGRVFLVGQIVQAGTADVVELALTNRGDRQTIADQVPELAGQLRFHVVPDEPDEPWIEVTPGVEPTPGGGQSSIETFAG